MKYRVHLTAGSNGLPFSDTRQRADAALLLCETLARNVIRAYTHHSKLPALCIDGTRVQLEYVAPIDS